LNLVAVNLGAAPSGLVLHNTAGRWATALAAIDPGGSAPGKADGYSPGEAPPGWNKQLRSWFLLRLYRKPEPDVDL
jgi:hypothetical protein